MPYRLEHVLRAGEAHRLSVRTGALEVSDFTDDTLRLILEAVGQGDVKAACEGAVKWCSLNSRHHAMCREGGDALWTELTRRVFGPNPPAAAGSASDTAQQRFYALCRRDRARRWLGDNHLWKAGIIDAQIDEVDELMTYIDNGGNDTPEGRAQLANMLLGIAFHSDTYAYGQEAHAFARRFAKHQWIYTTLLEGTWDEVRVGLLLLEEYAMNQNHEQGMDERMGYYHEGIPTLARIITSDEGHETIALGVWTRLLDATNERRDEDHAETMKDRMNEYAKSMIDQGVNATLLDLINEGTGAGANVHDRELAGLAAGVLSQMTHALNRSPL